MCSFANTKHSILPAYNTIFVDKMRFAHVVYNCSWPKISTIETACETGAYVMVGTVQNASSFPPKKEQVENDYYCSCTSRHRHDTLSVQRAREHEPSTQTVAGPPYVRCVTVRSHRYFINKHLSQMIKREMIKAHHANPTVQLANAFYSSAARTHRSRRTKMSRHRSTRVRARLTKYAKRTHTHDTRTQCFSLRRINTQSNTARKLEIHSLYIYTTRTVYKTYSAMYRRAVCVCVSARPDHAYEPV